jgi:hypothetical protein
VEESRDACSESLSAAPPEGYSSVVPRRRATEIVTWSLVGAMVVAGGWVLFDRDKPTTGEQSARAGLLLRVWRQDDVTRITIVRGSETIELVREGERWSLTSPRAVPADLLSVTQLLNVLGGARAERAVGVANEKDRATFGLTNPRATVDVAMKGVAIHLVLGADVTAESDGGAPDAYVEVASYGDEKGGVFVVAADVWRAIDRGADAYRDPSLLGSRVSFDFTKVAVHTHDGGGVTLDRSPHATWRVSSGTPQSPVRADIDKVDALFQTFAGLKASPFVPDTTPVDASQGGTIDITLGGEPPLAVTYGGACPGVEKSVVVQLKAQQTSTGCVPRVTLEALGLGADKYVDAHLFALQFGTETTKISEIEAVKIEQAGKVILDVERRGDGLHMRAPDEEQVTHDATDHWLARLAAMQGVVLAPASLPSMDALGLATPQTKVTLRRRVDPITLGTADAGPDDWEQVIEIGAPVDDTSSTPPRKVVYVRRLDDGAIVRLAVNDVLSLGATAVLDLRSPTLLDVSADTIDRITTTTTIPGTIAFDLERPTPTGMFGMSSPKGLGIGASSVLSDAMRALATLSCERWAADRDDGSFGLASPQATIAIRRHLAFGADASAVPTDLAIDFGARAPDGIFARARGRDAVCVVPEGKLLALLRPPVDLSVVGFDPTDAPTIVVTKGATKRAVRFDGKLWHDAPDAGLPLGDVAARSFADALAGLRAESVVHLGAPTADEGMGAPALVVEQIDDTGKRIKRVTIGSLGKLENTPIRYARVDGLDATYALLRDDVDKILSAM